MTNTTTAVSVEQLLTRIQEAYQMRNNDMVQTNAICDEVLAASRAISFIKGEAEALSLKGFCHVQFADFALAIEYLKQALNLFISINDEAGVGTVKYNLGLVFMRMGDFQRALEYETQALEIRNKLNDVSGAANCHMQIGYVHEHFNDYETALQQYHLCYQLHQSVGYELGVASALLGLGSIAVMRNDHEKVELYLSECVAIRRRIYDPRGLGASMHRYGTYYFQNQQYDKAKECLNEGVDTARRTKDKMGIARQSLLLGRIHAAEKNYEEAIHVLQETLQLTKEIKLKSVEFEMHHALSEVYEAMGDYPNALASLRAYHKTKEEVLNADAAAKVKNLETIRQMESATKEAEIHRLRNVELKQAYQLIEEKNKDITDSINYARRIQLAMLPEETEVRDALKAYFILYKPKDIVSGDFYFVVQKKNIVYVAAADCTGHGVPGALMSMVGSEKLNEAVLAHDNVDRILSHLNCGIKNSLRQSESEDSTRDGMDIALCAIDFDKRHMHYAGANRPLWILRKNASEIEELKPTKAAIGGYTAHDQEFQSHAVSLAVGDQLYLCTDGYADLFNGANGKKLTTKRMKQLLVENASLPIAEQGVKLEQFATEWKAGAEQIDDVLVIGVRID